MKNIKLHKVKNHIAKLIREEEEKETKTITGLADAFRDVSIGLRKNQYKGIQGAEITEIKKLLDLVLQAAMDTNITTIIQRLEAVVGKAIKTGPTSLGQEDELGIEDETI
tara:strand:+ start:267 stop:596 length:330 start_codon:yes stop_codon:yes gene_type:complete